MNRLLCAILALPLLAASISHAAVFERDWKMSGDGLLTYDDVNRREWLDLNVSLLGQFPEPRLENAVAEISPGGLFEGFTWAKSQEIYELAHSAGINTATGNYGVNQAAVTNLIELLGATFPGTPTTTTRSVGFLDEIDGGGRQVGADFFVSFDGSGQGTQARLIVSASNDSLEPARSHMAGLFLYRVVPEPTTLPLTVLAMIGITAIRMRYRNR